MLLSIISSSEMILNGSDGDLVVEEAGLCLVTGREIRRSTAEAFAGQSRPRQPAPRLDPPQDLQSSKPSRRAMMLEPRKIDAHQFYGSWTKMTSG